MSDASDPRPADQSRPRRPLSAILADAPARTAPTPPEVTDPEPAPTPPTEKVLGAMTDGSPVFPKRQVLWRGAAWIVDGPGAPGFVRLVDYKGEARIKDLAPVPVKA